jgi:hypothetical protein
MTRLGPHLRLPFILGAPDPPGLDPPPSPAALLILNRLEHLRYDAESDRLLRLLVQGLVTGLERAHVVAYGTETCPAERVLSDPLLCPDWALPHAALYTGGTMPERRPGERSSVYTARARQAVIAPQVLPGTTDASAAAGRALLTGNKAIIVVERYLDDEWRTVFVTQPQETPDPLGFRAAINDPSVVLAGARIEHGMAGGSTWDDLNNTPWDELPTWDTLSGGA